MFYIPKNGVNREQSFSQKIVYNTPRRPWYNAGMEITLHDISNAVCAVMKDYDVLEVYIFGSYARGDQNVDSDIDLRFVCGPSMTFGALYEIVETLQKKLDCKIDVVTNPVDQMRPAFRDNVLRDEVKLYEAA